MTLNNYVASWLANDIKPTRKPATYIAYESVCRNHILPALGAKQVASITRQDIKKLIVAKTKSGCLPTTVLQTYRVLRSLLGELVEDDLILKNPAATLGKTKLLPSVIKEEADPFSVEEVASIMSAASSLDKDMYGCAYIFYQLAYRAGLRVGEVVALEWSDIDFDKGTIYIRRTVSGGEIVSPKSNKPRKVDMSNSLSEALTAHFLTHGLDSKYVMHKARGAMLDVRTLRRWHVRVMEKAGVRYRSPHNLRHTFAAHLLQRGATMVYVKEMCGHSSVKVTVDIYGRFAPGSVRDVNLLDEEEDELLG